MKAIRLTRRAEARLEEIAGWTIDRFGPEQARIYEAQLIHRLQALADGEPPHGKRCEIAGGAVGAKDLRYYRESGHYIVFRDTADALIVIDFVHGARNFERILADLAKKVGRE